MEGTPFVVEANNEDDQEKRRKEEEERSAKAKKPEALGILAIETPAAEAEPTAFQKAWEATRKPEAETAETPAPKPEQPAEVAAEPQAEQETEAAPVHEDEPELNIEHEPTPPAELPEPTVEREPETPVEAEAEITEEAPEAPAPEPEAVSEPVEEAPAPVEKAEPLPEPITEARPEAIVEPEPAHKAEEEPPEPAVEASPDSIAEPAAPENVPEAPAPEPKAAPEANPEPENPPEDDKKKPGFIRSLFGRGKRKETEAEPAAKPEEKRPETPEPESPAVEIRPDEPEEPKFEFKEKTEAEPVAKPEDERHETPEPEPQEEAPELERAEAKAERIGQVVVGSEAETPVRRNSPASEAVASSREAEKRMHVEGTPVDPATGKRVEQLDQAELLQLSDKVEINGNSLRHIYETHLIGERGLRRLVEEYLLGGDLSKALRREVREHEMDFERDPIMRNMKAAPEEQANGGSNAVLEKLLEKADVSLTPAGKPETHSLPSRPSKQKKIRSRTGHSYRNRQLDIVMMGAIGALSLLIILVLLVRG